MRLISDLYLSRLVLLATIGSAAIAAADFPVVSLPPIPSPAEIAEAKQAFEEGKIVAMTGGTVSAFEAMTNVAMPQSDSHHRQPPPCVQAVRKLPSGQVRKLLRMSHPFAPQDQMNCEAALNKWVSRQNLLEDQAIPYWTHIEDLSVPNTWTTNQGVDMPIDLSIYRANTVDPTADYYLVTYSMVAAPADGLPAPIPTLLQVSAQYANGLTAKTYAYGPQAHSSSISIGQGIAFDGNASGLYDASAAIQPFSLGQQLGLSVTWLYINNISPFTYQTAVIYQVPSGTTHLTLSTAAESGNINERLSNTLLVPISAPQVLLPELTFAMEGMKSSFEVTASSYLQTALAAIPGWMPQSSIEFTTPNGTVSQTPPTGVSSFSISFTVPAKPPCLDNGTCANPGGLEIQTVPAYAALQTKLPPVSVSTIELVPNSPTAGVLIAGGQDWNGTVLKTADVWDSNTGSITAVQSQLVQARYQHTATLVAPSSTCQQANARCSTAGQVLLAGGYGANGQVLSSTEFYNPATTQFTAGPTMTSPHAGAVAVQLQDGRVLIMGGLDQSGSATAVVDVYDPVSNTFSPTPLALTLPRWNFAVNVLQDGSVLVEGGSNGPSEYFGPATTSAEKLDNCGSGFYSLPNGPVTPRQAHSTALLKNGQVLIAGGYNGNDNGGGPLSQVEVFTPASNSFSSVSSLDGGHRFAALVRQEDGGAALIGGYNLANYSSIYDPNSQSFPDALLTFMTEQRDLPTAVRLEGIGTADKGKILVAGGVIPQTGSSNGELVELYDPVAHTWTAAGNLSASRRQNTSTLFGKYAGSLPATFGCN